MGRLPAASLGAESERPRQLVVPLHLYDWKIVSCARLPTSRQCGVAATVTPRLFLILWPDPFVPPAKRYGTMHAAADFCKPLSPL
jgi:hypothetical protein